MGKKNKEAKGGKENEPNLDGAKGERKGGKRIIFAKLSSLANRGESGVRSRRGWKY